MPPSDGKPRPWFCLWSLCRIWIPRETKYLTNLLQEFAVSPVNKNKCRKQNLKLIKTLHSRLQMLRKDDAAFILEDAHDSGELKYGASDDAVSFCA